MSDVQQAVTVALSRQLQVAMDINACFCIGCGQPDEPDLHDPARCPASGGALDAVPVATALEVYDDSCEAEPDLDGEARALHCVIIALSRLTEPARKADRLGEGVGAAVLRLSETIRTASHTPEDEAAIIAAAREVNSTALPMCASDSKGMRNAGEQNIAAAYRAGYEQACADNGDRVDEDDLEQEIALYIGEIEATLPDPTHTREGEELRRTLVGLELAEDGYSLRVAYDGDAADDGRAIVVGGETVVTFADSDEGEAVREAILKIMGKSA
jgi:hypothetical protein